MLTKSVDELAVGSVIAEPVMLGSHEVYSSGTRVTDTIKSMLIKLDIPYVVIYDNEGNTLRQFGNTTTRLNTMSLIALRSLDIDDITVTARDIVKDVVNTEFKQILDTIYIYDEDTKRHCVNVANLALIYGIKSKLPMTYIKRLILGSLLHDIGKTIIPEYILYKTQKLTDKEWELIRQHPVLGYNMIRDFKNIDSTVKRIVLEHHENFDGSGYPNGKHDMNIHILSRIVHVCDVYEALCSQRAYKPCMNRDDVRNYIASQSGSMLDPIVATRFLEIIPEFLIGEEMLLDEQLGVVTKSGNSSEIEVNIRNNVYNFEDLKNSKHIQPYSTLV